VKGVRDGYGVFYYANGSKYEGYWKDNMKEGFSFYTNENGKAQLILFKKDRMIRENHPVSI
jgi:antitoxin component YwqK of YwqJK toxin-antitoxin module